MKVYGRALSYLQLAIGTLFLSCLNMRSIIERLFLHMRRVCMQWLVTWVYHQSVGYYLRVFSKCLQGVYLAA